MISYRLRVHHRLRSLGGTNKTMINIDRTFRLEIDFAFVSTVSIARKTGTNS